MPPRSRSPRAVAGPILRMRGMTRAAAWPRVLLVLLLAAGIAPAARAQHVALRIRPQVGDTLVVRMDQEVEMSGRTRIGGVDSVARVHTTLHVRSRAVVERSDAMGTVLLTMTDSVALESNAMAPELLEDSRRALAGQRLRVRMAPDGATELAEGNGVRDDLRELFAQMPATLPREPVAVGERWTRAMPIPSPDGRPGASLKAVFRLDSLTRHGDVAWISMRGSITRDSTPDATSGVKMATAGTVSGTLVVDRQRGWLVSSRTRMTVRSTMTPPPTTRAEPLHFQMRITQWMRTAER